MGLKRPRDALNLQTFRLFYHLRAILQIHSFREMLFQQILLIIGGFGKRKFVVGSVKHRTSA